MQADHQCGQSGSKNCQDFRVAGSHLLETVNNAGRQKILNDVLWDATYPFIIRQTTKANVLEVTSIGVGAKNESFARLRRIWQTTQTFWETALDAPNRDGTSTIPQVPYRLQIKGKLQPNDQKDGEPGQYHTYDLKLPNSVKLSVVWDSENKRFITCDNLEYLAKPELLGQRVLNLLPTGGEITIEEPTGYGGKNKTWGKITIEQADTMPDSSYTPVILILAQPRTFMALVPADRALAIIAAIRTKYEQEVGKVRNRLPLHLGLVYFHRRTPLRAALDAGRRMLKYELGTAQDEVWRVTEKVQGPLPDGKIHLAEKENGQFAQTVTVKLERNRRSLTWHVPAKMGDGQTDDNWYPYVFIKSDVNGRSPAFKGIRPTSDNKSEECWLLHASQLQKDDQIYFTPATLDFQWLDSTARRFEIAYGDNGRRRDHLTRPYLLDELDEIEAAWAMLRTLSKNQLYTLRDTVEEKRAAWFVEPHESLKDDTFKQFCADIIRNTKWKTAVDTTKLTNWAINGLLADAIQLHVSIMKDKLQPSSREEHTNE